MKGNEGQTRKPAGALKKVLAFGCAAAMVLAFAPTAAFAAAGAALPDLGSVFASLADDSDVVAAPLVDHAADHTVTNVEPSDYKAEPGTIENGVTSITMTATGLVKHANANGTVAYWIGVGIPAASTGSNLYAKAYGTTDEVTGIGSATYSEENKTSSFTKDGKTYDTLYFGTYSKFANKVAYVGVKASQNANPTIYKLDFSKTTVVAEQGEQKLGVTVGGKDISEYYNETTNQYEVSMGVDGTLSVTASATAVDEYSSAGYVSAVSGAEATATVAPKTAANATSKEFTLTGKGAGTTEIEITAAGADESATKTSKLPTPPRTVRIALTVNAAPAIPAKNSNTLSYTGEAQNLTNLTASPVGYTLASKAGAAKEATIDGGKGSLYKGVAYGTDAGAYTVVATLDPGYVWAKPSGNATTYTDEQWKTEQTSAKELSTEIAKTDIVLGLADEDGTALTQGVIHKGETADFEVTAKTSTTATATLKGVKVTSATVTTSTCLVTAKADADSAKITLDATAKDIPSTDSSFTVLVEVAATDNFNYAKGELSFKSTAEETLTYANLNLPTSLTYNGEDQVILKASKKWIIANATPYKTYNGATYGDITVNEETFKAAYAKNAATWNVNVTPAPGYKWDSSLTVEKDGDALGYVSSGGSAIGTDNVNKAVNFICTIAQAGGASGATDDAKVKLASNTGAGKALSASGMLSVAYGKTAEFTVAAYTGNLNATTPSLTKIAGVNWQISPLSSDVAALSVGDDGKVTVEGLKPGTLTVTATPSSGGNDYVLASTPTATVAITVNAKDTVAKPTAASLSAYTGKQQNAVQQVEGYTLSANAHTEGSYTYKAPEIVTVKGDNLRESSWETWAVATNAGLYSVKATLLPGYAWADTTTADVPVNFEIAQAEQTLTVKNGNTPVAANSNINVPYGTPAKLDVTSDAEGAAFEVSVEDKTTSTEADKKVLIDTSYDAGKLTLGVNDSFTGKGTIPANTVTLKATTGDGNYKDVSLVFEATATKGKPAVLIDGEKAASKTINMLASTSVDSAGQQKTIIDLATDPDVAVFGEPAVTSTDTSGATGVIMGAAFAGKTLTITSAAFSGSATKTATVTVTPKIADTDTANKDRYDSGTPLEITVNVTPASVLTTDDEALAASFVSALGKVQEAAATPEAVNGNNYEAAYAAMYGKGDGVSADTPAEGSAAAVYKTIKDQADTGSDAAVKARGAALLAYVASSIDNYDAYEAALTAQDTADGKAAATVATAITAAKTALDDYTAKQTKGTANEKAETLATLASKAEAARAAYDGMTSANAKSKVTTTDLVDAEKALSDHALAGIKAQAASLAKLKAGTELTADEKAAVKAAVDEYKNLSAAAKNAMVASDKETCDAAVATYDDAVDEAKQAQEAADKAALSDEVAAALKVDAEDLSASQVATLADAVEKVEKAYVGEDGEFDADLMTSVKAYRQYAKAKAAVEAYGYEHDLANATVSFAPASAAYTGAAVTPAVTLTTPSGATVPESGYVPVWTDAAGNPTAGNVLTDAGSYTLTVTGAAPYTGSATAAYTVGAASQTVTAKGVTVKAKKAKKKAVKVAASFAASGGGKVTWAKASKGKVSIAKNGKVTVKKGAKKGTYKLKVKVTAAANGNYAATAATVTLVVKVK